MSIFAASNLLYIQRFRYHKSLDGEAAYCLTNLEAAVSFLENVDMTALSQEKYASEPLGTSEAPQTAQAADASRTTIVVNPPSLPNSDLRESLSAKTGSSAVTSTPSLPEHIGELREHHGQNIGLRRPYFAPVEFAASAASSAVNTADQSLKTIGSGLENSYKFLFGRLSDKTTELPRTLEDVRRLVSTPSQDGVEPVIPSSSHVSRGSGSGLNKAHSLDQFPDSQWGINPNPSALEGPPKDVALSTAPVADSVRNM